MPVWLLAVFAGLLGAVLASFGQCVVTRTRQGRSWITGRSSCDFCGHQLSWYENIPVVSYLLQGGKSRCCKKSLSATYFLSEFIAAVLAASIVMAFA
jgi:leader peptidase (prepilin peptidase)/N-methyltransferase